MPGFRTTVLAALLFLTAAGLAQPAKSSPENGQQRAAGYLDAVRNDPSLLLEFLRRMPKGGDLHNHLSGAVYAESYLKFAAADGLCLQKQTAQLVAPTVPETSGYGNGHGPQPEPSCDGSGLVPASRALSDSVLYRETINAWSMRNFHAGADSNADHFFDTFRKFGPATQDHVGDMLAEVVSRAGHENVQYLELILDPTKKQPANRLGEGLNVTDDFAALRRQILDKGVARVVAASRSDLDQAETRMRALLHCSSATPDPGCAVEVRYIFEVHRALKPEQVFAEMVTGFEMASADPRVLAVNLVMPEDAYVSMRDFDLHMRMMDYLHAAYPKVRITLHAGELAPQLVPPEGLRSHIRESVEVGHAERIGHGDDVMYEHDPIGLLREMARRKVLVEVCLTSNDLILGVRGLQHPLPMYLRFGVPVALATDDEGVSRSNLVQEFLRAVQTYHLSYGELKHMVRNSAEHSFLPGESLWAALPLQGDPKAVAACSSLSGGEPSPACRKFLDASPRAALQWRVEKAFTSFEDGNCCELPSVAHAVGH